MSDTAKGLGSRVCWGVCWLCAGHVLGVVLVGGAGGGGREGGGGGRRKLVSKAFSIRLYIIIPAASQRT